MHEMLNDDSLSIINNDSIANWSDDRKMEFSKVLEKRVKASQYVLLLVAHEVFDEAYRRYFVPRKDSFRNELFQGSLNGRDLKDRSCRHVGGRSIEELEEIAKERSASIIRSLPTSIKAVQIIDPETAKKMDRKKKIVEELKTLKDEVEEVGGEIRLSDVDQNMTISEFRKMLETKNNHFDSLIRKIEKLSKEGNDLEEQIGKALYSGLPEIRDAVKNVCKRHLERAKALSATGRRVTEQVLFGDSQAALEILRSFEKDEVGVDKEIQDEFNKALQSLNIALVAKKATAKKAPVKKATAKKAPVKKTSSKRVSSRRKS